MSRSPRRLLVIDDDVAIVESLVDALQDEGYSVDSCPDGSAALDYLRTHPRPCLILLDWMMPGCDGATFRAQQKEDPAIATIPVVLLTADLRVDEKSKVVDAVAYLPKPVDLGLLLSLIEQHCEKRDE